jgi:aryl-alcohol dehydrogenase-like predicted oxidoreductase
LGLAAVGRPGYLNVGHDRDLGPDKDVDALRRRAHEVLDAAWAAGLRWYDAARSYGRAEEFLAGWLRDRHVAPGEVSVSSKWGYTYTAGWRARAEVHEVKDHSVATLRRQWAESAALLAPYLTLYQIHSATPATGVLEDRAVLAELAGLGLPVGLSVSGPDQADSVRMALAAEVDGVNPFSAVQATWNLLEPSAGPALAQAAARGWVVLVKEGLANGRLAPGGHPALEQAAADRGVTLDALALAAALAQPWTRIVLSGAVTVEQLQSNLRARDLHLDPAEVEALLTPEPPGRYWSARAAMTWT